MNRRNVLGLIAGLSGATALSIGSGAFSYVRAERGLDVEVVSDKEAYLGLSQEGTGERSDEDGTPQTVNFSFPGDQERLAYPDKGLGTDSVYRFVNDAGEISEQTGEIVEPEDTPGLLTISNQGTNTVGVYSQQPDTDGPAVGIFRVDPDDGTPLDNVGDPVPGDTYGRKVRNATLLTEETPAPVDPGDAIRVGFEIDTHGVPPKLFEYETISIVGDESAQP